MEQLTLNDNNFKLIKRIRFLRSIKSHYVASQKIQFDIIVSSEFNEIDNSYNRSKFDISFCTANLIADDIDNKNYSNGNYSASVLKSGGARIILEAPSNAGRYQILIRCRTLNNEQYILSLLSECFEILSTPQQSHGSNIYPLLSCYRRFHVSKTESILIKEDYGATLGSHIYDASIVLFKYLLLNNRQYNDSINILELGAGCGLVGIAIAKMMSTSDDNKYKIVLTDKQCQIPLLQHNISINVVSSNCQCSIFDWSNSNDLLACKDKFTSGIDLIIAGDVFYDREVASMFIDIASQLSTSGRTQIIVAQKLRTNHSNNIAINNSNSNNVDEMVDSRVSGLIDVKVQFKDLFNNIELLHSEAEVLLWSIT